MNSIIVKTVHGSKVEHNSMYEEDLSQPMNLDSFYSVPEGERTQKRVPINVPPYLGQNDNMGIEDSPLWKYLNDEK